VCAGTTRHRSRTRARRGVVRQLRVSICSNAAGASRLERPAGCSRGQRNAGRKYAYSAQTAAPTLVRGTARSLWHDAGDLDDPSPALEFGQHRCEGGSRARSISTRTRACSHKSSLRSAACSVSALPLIATGPRTFREVWVVPILLQKSFRLRSAQHRFVGRVHVARKIQNAVRGRTNVAPRTYSADFCNTICQ
jgi:hypothetical protein